MPSERPTLKYPMTLMLRYIEWHWWRYGRGPSTRELAAGFEVSMRTIYSRCWQLFKKGYLERHVTEWGDKTFKPVQNRSESEQKYDQGSHWS